MLRKAKKPDVKAPRYRPTAKKTVDTDLTRELHKEHPSLKSLSHTDIRNIIKTFNEKIWESVINYRDGVELPEQLGALFIGTCEPKKGTNVDFKGSSEYLRVVEHRNWESDRYLAKIFYTTYGTKYRFRHHELWEFKACRNFTRAVGATYPKKWKMYIQVPRTIKISSLFKRAVRRMEIKAQEEVTLLTYNEFNL